MNTETQERPDDAQQRPSDPPPWFHTAIGRGLQLLSALSLPGSPLPDMVEATHRSWTVAIWRMPRRWREEDAARLEEAFVRAAGSVTRWPSPAEVISMTPSRKDHRRTLERPTLTDEQIARNKKKLRDAVRSAGLRRT